MLPRFKIAVPRVSCVQQVSFSLTELLATLANRLLAEVGGGQSLQEFWHREFCPYLKCPLRGQKARVCTGGKRKSFTYPEPNWVFETIIWYWFLTHGIQVHTASETGDGNILFTPFLLLSTNWCSGWLSTVLQGLWNNHYDVGRERIMLLYLKAALHDRGGQIKFALKMVPWSRRLKF